MELSSLTGQMCDCPTRFNRRVIGHNKDGAVVVSAGIPAQISDIHMFCIDCADRLSQATGNVFQCPYEGCKYEFDKNKVTSLIKIDPETQKFIAAIYPNMAVVCTKTSPAAPSHNPPKKDSSEESDQMNPPVQALPPQKPAQQQNEAPAPAALQIVTGEVPSSLQKSSTSKKCEFDKNKVPSLIKIDPETQKFIAVIYPNMAVVCTETSPAAPSHNPPKKDSSEEMNPPVQALPPQKPVQPQNEAPVPEALQIVTGEVPSSPQKWSTSKMVVIAAAVTSAVLFCLWRCFKNA